jgi:hypothetical protein
MEKKSVGLLELEMAVLECFLEKTPLSPLGVNCKLVVIIELESTLLKYTLNGNCIYDHIGDMISGVVSIEELAPYFKDIPPYNEGLINCRIRTDSKRFI